eukprot:TRINITY_DN2009_c0_g1_i2.p2 TRINITY_DN2009_c0_g1~~TRINITY_DN2009_c0_g1_i2.p2  ORF type:complete len:259 (-),score=85.45 TRINITY_DN2009_c0_g1_i2:146-922(-)
MEVEVLLSGDFDAAYTKGDNSKVIPTDTCKNTVYVLAKKNTFKNVEEFGKIMTKHFLGMYSWVTGVKAVITEATWERAIVNGKPHKHTFRKGDNSRCWAQVTQKRGRAPVVLSGIRQFQILKTTGSGFVGYNKCENTTLVEDTDRLMGTKADITWTYSSDPPCYTGVRNRIAAITTEIFANSNSRSVQETMYDMAKKVIAVIPQVDNIRYNCPNVHNIPVNLAPFGLSHHAEIHYPIDEPHGQIGATFTRASGVAARL